MTENLCFFIFQASVVALHAFVGGNKIVATRRSLQQGQRRGGFIDVLPIQALWVLSREMMHANLNSERGGVLAPLQEEE